MKKTIRIPEHLQSIFDELDNLGISYSSYINKLIENDKRNTIKQLQQKYVDTDEWYTPKYVLDWLRREYDYNFTLDPATNAEQMELLGIEKGYTIEDNGLVQDWDTKGTIWMNPPFSKTKQFVSKARIELEKHPELTIICLLKFQPDSTAWKEHINGRAEILVPRDKIKFFNDNKDTITYGGQNKIVLVRLTQDECDNIKYIDIY